VSAAAAALEGPAELVVFPELAVPGTVLDQLTALVVGARRNVVVVAGSRHDVIDGRRQNVSTLITPSGDRIIFAKRTPFWDAKTRESIDPALQPLRILVAGNVRLAVPVCKDSLAEPTVDVLARCGANVIIAPSMSRVTNLHDIAARIYAMKAHALTVVVNGPRTFATDEPAQLTVSRPEADPARMIVSTGGVRPVAVIRFDLVSGAFETDAVGL
jgi:predicted amidohydrolase